MSASPLPSQAQAQAQSDSPSPSSSSLLARPAATSSLRVPTVAHHHQHPDSHTPASSSSTTPNPSTCPSTTSTASSLSQLLAKPDQTLLAQQTPCARLVDPLSDLPVARLLDLPVAASPIVADWLEGASAAATHTPSASPVLGPVPAAHDYTHSSLATPRQQSAGLSTVEPAKSLATLTPSDKTIKASTIPVPPSCVMSPSPTKPSLPAANSGSSTLQIPLNTGPSRSPNTPPTNALHATFALAAPSISPSNSARASPVRSTTSPNPHGHQMSKLGPTTKLDVGVKTGAEAQVKSPVHAERKSMFGKLFEKRNGDSSSKAYPSTTDVSKSSGSGLAVNSITPSTNDGSGNESETLTAVKKSMLGRKPSNNKKSNGTEQTGNGMATTAAQSVESSSVMGILSRQASTSNGILNGGTSKLLSVNNNNNNNKSSSDKSGEEKVVVSSSSKLRDMVGGKLGRKPSSSKPPRSDDGRSEEIQHGGDAKSKHGGGSQATSTLLKKYGVCEKAAIGKGATAVVRLAHKWDRGTDKLYAVKEFRKRRKNESEKEYVKKLTSEFCISSTLHHENIVETVDLVQDENQHWCEVMEYCPGGDLYAAIKRGSMSQADIHSYFKQMLLGVDYLHRMGVAHRDIKPENLLLDGKGKIKITDFGVSDVFRMCWEKTTHLSKGLCGSEPYLPKEMFERKEYDARLVDVWACAVVYYCCCIQELPWRVAKKNDPSFQIYLQAYESGSNAPPPISNLIRESRSLIRKMWCPEPEDRIYIDQVLKDPWVMSLEVFPGSGTGTGNNGGNVPVVGGPSSSLGGLNPSVVTPAIA